MRTNPLRQLATSLREAGVSDTKILWALANWGGDTLHERLNNRAATAAMIEDSILENGKVAIYVWQRDCDCAEWSYATEIEPTFLAYQKLQQSVYDGAEGPVSFAVLHPDDYAEFHPESRDRVLEAFENGSSYRV